MSEAERDVIVVSADLLKPSGGSPLAVVEVTLAMMSVSREAMAICARNARPFATNRAFRQMQSEHGDQLELLVERAMAGHLSTDLVVDDALQLEGRAAPIALDGGPQMYVVALSDAGLSPNVTARTVRTVRECLERALLSIDEPNVLPPSVLDPLRPLTFKEGAVFDLLVAGLRVSSIARTLHVSESTVRSHLKAIFRKSGVHSQAGLLEKLHGMASLKLPANGVPACRARSAKT